MRSKITNQLYSQLEKHDQLPIYVLSGTKSVFLWCYKNYKLYFLYKNKERVFFHCSWSQEKIIENPFYLLQDLFGPQYSFESENFLLYRPEFIDYANWEADKIEKKKEKIAQKSIKSLEKKRSKIESDIKICSKWKDHFIIVQNYYNNELDKVDKYMLEGKSIKLAGSNHYQKRDFLLKKLKGYKRGYEIQLKRLEELNAIKKENINLKIPQSWVTPVLVNHIKRDKIKQFTLDNTIKGIIGTNAYENNLLRKKTPSKEYLWFHINQRTSAHIIVFIKKIEELTQEQINVIGSMLCFYSKETLLEIPLIYAQVKDTSTVSHKTGSVKISHPFYTKAYYLSNWTLQISFY